MIFLDDSLVISDDRYLMIGMREFLGWPHFADPSTHPEIYHITILSMPAQLKMLV